MATTELPPSKEKAHEIARKIANERPLKKDKDAPDSNVSGGFNQKSRASRRMSTIGRKSRSNCCLRGMKRSGRSGISGAMNRLDSVQPQLRTRHRLGVRSRQHALPARVQSVRADRPADLDLHGRRHRPALCRGAGAAEDLLPRSRHDAARADAASRRRSRSLPQHGARHRLFGRRRRIPIWCEAIGALPGRKFILTNGDVGHSKAVLEQVGAPDLFDDIFDIRSMKYKPKPLPEAYEEFFAAARHRREARGDVRRSRKEPAGAARDRHGHRAGRCRRGFRARPGRELGTRPHQRARMSTT